MGGRRAALWAIPGLGPLRAVGVRPSSHRPAAEAEHHHFRRTPVRNCGSGPLPATSSTESVPPRGGRSLRTATPLASGSLSAAPGTAGPSLLRAELPRPLGPASGDVSSGAVRAGPELGRLP